MSPSKEPNIVIREAWGDEKEVGFRGIEHIEMPEEEMLDLIDKYGDTLIALDEIDEEYDGLDWCWHVGEVVSQMNNKGDFAKLNRYTDLDIGDDWTLLRYINFYKLFPKKGFDDRISKSVYMEMCVGERLDEARKAYENLVNFHGGSDIIVPAVYEVRAWANTPSFDVESIVGVLQEEAKGQTSNLDTDKLHRGVKRVLIMEGKDPEGASKEKVIQVMGTQNV